MKKELIIAAGGIGKRMGDELPKQFLLLGGKPIIMHTIEKFYRYNNSMNVIIVLPKEQRNLWNTIVEKYSFTIPHTTVNGGEMRFDSVKNGLSCCGNDSLIAIHDAVRPFVSTGTIDRCFRMAEEKGCAIPVLAPAESVRIITGGKCVPVDRNTVRLIQTPQIFKSNIIKEAYSKASGNNFTDDAQVVESDGNELFFAEGNIENIKITNQCDMLIADAFIQQIDSSIIHSDKK